MTHGSFPGQPRGRRARRDGDEPEWQGYDATPPDQREFPDLSPVRPREARGRHGRGPAEQQAQPGGFPGAGAAGAPPDSPAAGGYSGGQYGDGQYGGGQHRGGQYGGNQPGGDQYGGDQYGSGRYGDGGYGGPGQAPWPERQRPDQAGAPQPGAPGQSGAAPSAPYQPSAGASSQLTEAELPEFGPEWSSQVDGESTPSWAEPDSEEAFSERWHRRGLDSRDERRSGRRNTRRLLIAGGTVLVLVIAATIYLLSGGPGAAKLGFGSFVTSFLPGEFQQVPNPCETVPAATLNQYLPGKLKEAAPPLNSGASTQCTWTLDAAPTYRVLEVQLQAYSPSGLASGNGSATFAAEDAFQSFENGFTSPGPDSGQPKATVTDLSGLPGGSQTSAFQATQVFNRGGATTDVANVLVRYRNVIVTVVLDGLDQTSGGKNYGPVSMSELTTAAKAVATEMAAQIAK